MSSRRLSFPADLLDRLRLKHFSLLNALAEHRSVTQVAQLMGVSQPSVTRSLLEIEDIFRMPLFVRNRRGLQLTPAGETVLGHARAVLAGSEALALELDVVRDGRRGRLRVGMIPYVAGTALDAMWRHLMTFDPQLSIAAVEGTTSELIGHLRAGALDCAICRFSHDELGGDVVQELLYQQQAHLVVANASAKTIVKNSGLDIASLSAMDWIFPPPDTPTRRIIDAIFASGGRRVPTPVVEANSIRVISTAMQWMPRGVTVLPRDIALTVASSGFCEMLDEALPWRMPPVGLAWTTNASKSRTAAALAATIRKEVGMV